MKKLPKIKGIKEILYPGQNKYVKYKKNLKSGIEIPKGILKEINKLNAI
jgi:LDH2 family malate/lactate/ureidoglycolate dehydrogenase